MTENGVEGQLNHLQGVKGENWRMFCSNCLQKIANLKSA